MKARATTLESKGESEANMFDAVLSKQEREQRYGAGTILALLTYAAAIGAAFLILPSGKDTTKKQDDVEVTLYTALSEPAPPPPPPPGPATPEPSRPKPKVVKPIEKPIVQPKVEPTPIDKALAEPTPEPTEPAPSSNEPPEPAAGGGGVVGGVVGGVQGGVVGGTVGGTVGAHGTGTQVIPFGPGMIRPERISGSDPVYPNDARAARVEGKMLVRCVITVTGEVTNCQVIKGLPMLTDVVLASLKSSRYTPIQYRGVPQAIQYLFTFNFKVP